MLFLTKLFEQDLTRMRKGNIVILNGSHNYNVNLNLMNIMNEYCSVTCKIYCILKADKTHQ